MKAEAIRTFKLGRAVYQAGDPVELPENQFNDFAAVGLVRAAPKRAAKSKSELPVPGNVQPEEGSD